MSDYSGYVGGAVNVFTTLYNNWQARQREKQARLENYQYNEMAANNADQRHRAMYHDLYSPEAQIQQLKEAGLSPSIMADGLGASGATGAQGEGASGISPTIFGINPLQGTQIELMKAQARKTNAEAANEEGTGAKGKAQIELWIAQTLGEQAKANYNNMQTAISEYDLQFKQDTHDINIRKLDQEAESAYHNGQLLMYKAKEQEALATIATETIQEKIKQIQLETDALSIGNALKRSAIRLNNQQIEHMAAEIDKWRKEILQNDIHLLNEAKNAKSYEDYVQNMRDYQNDQIQQLYERLHFDEQKFDREQKLKIAQFIYAIWNGETSKFINGLLGLVDAATPG